MSVIGAILGLILGIVLICLVLANLIDGIWRLASTIWVRRRLALAVVTVMSAAIMFTLTILVPSLDIGALLVSAMLTVPLPASYVVARLAFRLDGAERKSSAMALRTELAERFREDTDPPSSFWLDYVFDAERAERRKSSQPPPL